MTTIQGDERLTAVGVQVDLLASTDGACESGYARLGWLLLEVAQLQLWRIHHDTFRAYLRALAIDSTKTVETLHRYFLTVRDLSDTFTCAQLEVMGISKAMKLRQAKEYAIVLPQEVVTAALDPKVTVKELQKVIAVILKMPEEEGDWMDLEFEFMVSAEQRELFEQVINVAMHTEPLTKSTISKSAQMLDIMVKLSMEFLGSHSGDGL